MSETLTAAEQQAVDRTAAKIEALRADSRRRQAEEARNPRARKRRRENFLAFKQRNASA